MDPEVWQLLVGLEARLGKSTTSNETTVVIQAVKGIYIHMDRELDRMLTRDRVLRGLMTQFRIDLNEAAVTVDFSPAVGSSGGVPATVADSLVSAMDRMQRNLESLNDQMEAQRTATFQRDVVDNETNDKLNKLHKRVTNFQADLGSDKSRWNWFERRMRGLQEGIADCQSCIDHVASGSAASAAAMQSLDTKLAKTHCKLKRLCVRLGIDEKVHLTSGKGMRDVFQLDLLD